MAESTAAERATQLEEQVDFERRSKEFGEGLDELIKKTQVGITIKLSAVNHSVQNNVLMFDNIQPYIARIDLKKIAKAQEESEKQNGKGKKKAK